MTIEEKAKRYDEAIKLAKDSYNYPSYPGFIRADVVFPELKESEDERIKETLIDYFKTYKKQEECGIKTFFGIPTDNIIAWLEKQGEHVEINPTEFDTRLQALIGKFETLPKEELVGSLSFWLNVVQNDGTYKREEKQDEQKPTEEYNITGIGSKNAQGKLGEMIKNLKPADKIEPNLYNKEDEYT